MIPHTIEMALHLKDEYNDALGKMRTVRLSLLPAQFADKECIKERLYEGYVMLTKDVPLKEPPKPQGSIDTLHKSPGLSCPKCGTPMTQLAHTLHFNCSCFKEVYPIRADGTAVRSDGKVVKVREEQRK